MRSNAFVLDYTPLRYEPSHRLHRYWFRSAGLKGLSAGLNLEHSHTEVLCTSVEEGSTG